MEDRFLYRAYIKSRKEIVYLRGFEIKVSECGKFETVTLYYKNGGFEVCSLNDVILMQCTGLKDKNGTLIYEGDILHTRPQDAEVIVYWESGQYQVKDTKDGTVYDLLINMLFDKDCLPEIISNIYETPELLNERK